MSPDTDVTGMAGSIIAYSSVLELVITQRTLLHNAMDCAIASHVHVAVAEHLVDCGSVGCRTDWAPAAFRQQHVVSLTPCNQQTTQDQTGATMILERATLR